MKIILLKEGIKAVDAPEKPNSGLYIIDDVFYETTFNRAMADYTQALQKAIEEGPFFKDVKVKEVETFKGQYNVQFPHGLVMTYERNKLYDIPNGYQVVVKPAGDGEWRAEEEYKNFAFLEPLTKQGPEKHDPELCGCEGDSAFCPYNPKSEYYDPKLKPESTPVIEQKEGLREEFVRELKAGIKFSGQVGDYVINQSLFDWLESKVKPESKLLTPLHYTKEEVKKILRDFASYIDQDRVESPSVYRKISDQWFENNVPLPKPPQQ